MRVERMVRLFLQFYSFYGSTRVFQNFIECVCSALNSHVCARRNCRNCRDCRKPNGVYDLRLYSCKNNCRKTVERASSTRLYQPRRSQAQRPHERFVTRCKTFALVRQRRSCQRSRTRLQRTGAFPGALWWPIRVFRVVIATPELASVVESLKTGFLKLQLSYSPRKRSVFSGLQPALD